MRRLNLLAALLAVALTTSFATLSSSTPEPAAPAGPSGPGSGVPGPSGAARDLLADLPVSFEPAGDQGFISRGPGYSLTLSPADAVVAVGDTSFRLRPAGPTANPAAELVGGDTLPGTVSRIRGDDPARWTTGLTTFARVEARHVWPGVDMVWRGNGRALEHDMVVSPGTDPAVVALDVEGAQGLTLDPSGDLLIDLGPNTARLARPVVYQDVAGSRRPVPGEFALLGPSRIGFRLGAYDAALPLVIDPTLVTSTFLGGIGSDAGFAIAVDPEGNTIVAGATESVDFPTNAPLQTSLNSVGTPASSDVFVSKISPDGTRLVWSTYIGGRGRDTGYAVAVAGDGSVYVAGVTESPDFPAARAVQSSSGGGTSDGFVARIAANGSGLEWSSFIGGGGTDRARGLAVDSTGNAYVTGSTGSADFPSVNPQQPGPFRPDDLDAFLVKLPPSGTPYTFATRLGGGNDDRGLAVAIDTQGNAYVTGDTLSPGFPTVKPFQAQSGGSAGGAGSTFPDAFVAKYNPNGSALIYSTFLGGSDFDQGTSIAVDAQGAAYVAGNTNSPNFPTAGPVQATKGGEPDAFVAKIDPPGGALVYSTYLGGSGADGANGIVVDRTGSAHVVGTTGSANWTTAKPTQAVKAGGDDAFVVRLDSTGRGPLFSSFVGGKDAEAGTALALDAQGAVHLLGQTGSADFPSVKPVTGSRPAAGGDAFVATLSLVDAAAPSTTAPGIDAAAPAASSGGSSAHDRRVRTLFVITLGLLLVAVAQTLFLRRRTPAVAGAPGRRPAPASSGPRGLHTFDDIPAKGGAKKAGASAKAPMPPRSSRTPKARGGPKGSVPKAGGPAKSTAPKAGGAKKAAVAKGTPAPAEERVIVAEIPTAVEAGGEAGPPTVAAEALPPIPPAPPAPSAPKAKPQNPAIARLLEEEFWAPDPSEQDEPAPDAGPPDEPDAPSAAPEWAPFDTGSTPVVGPVPPADAGPPLPPVPAEELSFWDLFPEDLPPARATPFPTEDLLVGDSLALPEGPGSAAGRLVASPPASQPPPEPPSAPSPAPSPPAPPEAEIVIAELLDGPVPTGIRPSAESTWAPDGDDFRVDELLAERQPPTVEPPPDPGHTAPAEASEAHLAEATTERTKEEQARIAADRARRRRSRRSGGRKPPG